MRLFKYDSVHRIFRHRPFAKYYILLVVQESNIITVQNIGINLVLQLNFKLIRHIILRKHQKSLDQIANL